MAIVAEDMEWRYSVKTGSAGDSTAGTPAGSLGKYMSQTVADFTVLFDDVSGAENAANDVEYRCVFLLNNHLTLTYQASEVWLESQVGGGADLAIAVDGVGVVDLNTAAPQADEVADESTAPTGESFVAAAGQGSAISIGDIPPQDCVAVWIRRSITGGPVPPVANDGGVLKISGDTAA